MKIYVYEQWKNKECQLKILEFIMTYHVCNCSQSLRISVTTGLMTVINGIALTGVIEMGSAVECPKLNDFAKSGS